jgi:cholesterol oxidase
LQLTSEAGRRLTLVGQKEIHDDPGADLWRDTTTLPVRLFAGHLPPGAAADDRPLASGVLTLHLPDFLRQLTTFRADGDQPARALERFGQLFLGELWQVYGSTLGRVT